MTYYMVFEKPIGSTMWTLAYQGNGLAACRTSKSALEEWATEEYKTRKGWHRGVPDVTPMEWHMASVEVPE